MKKDEVSKMEFVRDVSWKIVETSVVTVQWGVGVGDRIGGLRVGPENVSCRRYQRYLPKRGVVMGNPETLGYSFRGPLGFCKREDFCYQGSQIRSV